MLKNIDKQNNTKDKKINNKNILVIKKYIDPIKNYIINTDALINLEKNLEKSYIIDMANRKSTNKKLFENLDTLKLIFLSSLNNSNNKIDEKEKKI